MKATTWDVLWRKIFLKIYQNSEESACVRVSFLIKLEAFSRVGIFKPVKNLFWKISQHSQGNVLCDKLFSIFKKIPIACIFLKTLRCLSEQLFNRTSMNGCFWIWLRGGVLIPSQTTNDPPLAERRSEFFTLICPTIS